MGSFKKWVNASLLPTKIVIGVVVKFILAIIISAFPIFSTNIDDAEDEAELVYKLTCEIPNHRNPDLVRNIVDEFNNILKIRLPIGDEECNLMEIDTLGYLQEGSVSLLLNNQPYVVSGCSWAAKVLGFATIERDFRKKLLSTCLKMKTLDETSAETFLNTVVGNEYLYPSVEIYQVLSSYNIKMLCGMYLVPVGDDTYAGLTYGGMLVLSLSEFKNRKAEIWRTVIERKNLGRFEPEFAPARWQFLEESLREHGGIERLAKPESWVVGMYAPIQKNHRSRFDKFLLERSNINNDPYSLTMPAIVYKNLKQFPVAPIKNLIMRSE